MVCSAHEIPWVVLGVCHGGVAKHCLRHGRSCRWCKRHVSSYISYSRDHRQSFSARPVACALVVGSVHSISWLPEFHLEPSSVGIAQWMWTLFVTIVSVVCVWWCAKEAAEEEMRRLSDRET